METIIKAVVRILAVVDGDMLTGAGLTTESYMIIVFYPEGMNAIPQERW